VCCSYLWGKLKQNMYRSNLRTPEALKNEMRSVIHDITEGELQWVSQNFLSQCQACFNADGHHFWSLSLKSEWVRQNIVHHN
jgi:hypothetical protein